MERLNIQSRGCNRQPVQSVKDGCDVVRPAKVSYDQCLQAECVTAATIQHSIYLCHRERSCRDPIAQTQLGAIALSEVIIPRYGVEL